jgi:hypothetical protein
MTLGKAHTNASDSPALAEQMACFLFPNKSSLLIGVLKKKKINSGQMEPELKLLYLSILASITLFR